jgi:hypothetical protein
MATDANRAQTAFHWNAGGWFGSQLGCTLWLLILGLVLLSKDLLAAWACVAGFVMLNAWGLYLWRGRGQLIAYVAIQRFLLAASVIMAAVVAVVNIRGLSEPPTSGALVSTYLPYWVIAVAPGLMLAFFSIERNMKRRLGERGTTNGSSGPTSAG